MNYLKSFWWWFWAGRNDHRRLEQLLEETKAFIREQSDI